MRFFHPLCVIVLGLTACGATSAPVPTRLPAPVTTSQQAASPCAKTVGRHLKTIELRSSSRRVVGRTEKHYDRLGRVTRVESDLDGDGQLEKVERYTYDEQWHLIGLEDGSWLERYQRDREGRIAVREIQRKGSKLSSRVVITYDDHGRKLRELSDIDDIRFAYDTAGREAREQRFRLDEETPYLDYASSYDAAGRLVLQQGHDPNGQLRKTWLYDERGREQQRDWYRDGALLLRTRVRYDASGRRVSEERTDDKDEVVGRDSWTYDSFGDEASHRMDNLEDNEWAEERYAYTALARCRP